jgi:hypothetical protein
MALEDFIGPLVYNILVISGFSMFLWKKNILSDLFEQTFLATSIALYFTAAFYQIQAQGITPLMNGQLVILIPIVFGILVYSQFSKKYEFFQRWSLALVIGVGLGIVIYTTIATTILSNFVISIMPIIGKTALDTFNNILMMVSVFTTLSYFIFTRPRTSALGASQKIGRYVMMLFFGASFGSFIMTRLSLLIGILAQFLTNFGIIK